MLPATHPNTPQAQPARQSSLPMKTLLLIPEPNERAMVTQAAEKSKHQTVSIETSEQAWRIIETGQIQLIIADWDASDVRPLKFIQRVRQAHSHKQLYILLVTSKVSDEELINCGADDYLRKPFSETEIKMRIIMASRILTLTSSLAAAHEQLAHQAIFDELTGFLNRSAFHKQALGELERARRSAIPFCVAAVEVDNFKAIVDQHGQETGNNVLKIVAQTIREKSRPYDSISRWSGDSFLMAVSGTIGADAEKVAERIIKSIRSMHITTDKNQPVDVNLSTGIVSVMTVNNATEIEPLLLKARQAVVRAKEAGGNQVFMISE